MNDYEGQHERRDTHHPLRRVNDYLPDGTTRTRRWSRPERTYRLTYRRHPMATLASTIAAMAALVMLAGTATVATTGMSGSTEKKGARADYSWVWSDDVRGGDRTFRAADYPGGEVPRILVTVPQGETPMVYLQFMQDGEWNTEWITRASNGAAKLFLDPWCQNGTWCDGTYDYRIKVGDAITRITVQYWEF
ncbi:MAG: hypothetical protein Q8M17_05435 [Actinomycetota bacterium]|nr:hypothetical protein [Actinomycetota bacterium]